MDSEYRRPVTPDDFHTIISTSIDGFLLVNLSGKILETNESYCQIIGYSRDELLERQITAIDVIDNKEDLVKRSELIIQNGSLRFEASHRHKSGRTIDVEISVTYSPSHGGTFFYFVRDISYQKRNRQIIEARLKLIEFSHCHTLHELLQETLDEAEKLTGSCIGFYHFIDSATQLLTLQAWSTRTAAEFCKAEGAGSHYPVSQAGVWVDCVRERRPVIHNDYATLAHRKGMPEGHAPVVRELVVPIFRKDNIVAILGVGNKMANYDQQDIEVITILADLAWEVAERKIAEEALKKSESILSSSQHLAKVGGWKWDVAQQFMTWTEETYRIHDFEPGSIRPGSPEHVEKSLECYNPEDRQTVLEAFHRCIEHGEEYDLEMPFTTASGRKLWIRTTAKPVWHEKRVSKVIGNIMDISERKQTEIALQEKNEIILRLAVTDELTGLNNRRYFNDCFCKEISTARRHKLPLSLISVDLDHFKNVNDTFGHSMGDQVLKEFALLLITMVRSEDIVSRLGGEEFMILLPNTTCEAAVSMANRIRCSIEETPRSTTPVVTASFGVAGLLDGEEVDDILKRVDAALYRAKHEGRNRVVAL